MTDDAYDTLIAIEYIVAFDPGGHDVDRGANTPTEDALAQLSALVGLPPRSGPAAWAAAIEEAFGTPVPADLCGANTPSPALSCGYVATTHASEDR